MTPIYELLNRIHWDKEFGCGQFEIGYLDLHEPALQRFRLEAVVFPKGELRVFEQTEVGTGAPDSAPSGPRGLARRQNLLEAPSLAGSLPVEAPRWTFHVRACG
jgi:MJ1316 RNA cyclic group end recognition domain